MTSPLAFQREFNNNNFEPVKPNLRNSQAFPPCSGKKLEALPCPNALTCATSADSEPSPLAGRRGERKFVPIFRDSLEAATR